MRNLLSTSWQFVICVVLCWCSVGHAQSSDEPPRFPEFTLLDRAMNEDFSRELGFDTHPENLTAIRELSTQLRKEFLERFINPAAEDQKDVKGLITRLQAKYEQELQKVLTPEHFTRLQQLDWQYVGLRSVLYPEVVKALELTKEQQEKLAAAEAQYSITSPANRPALRPGPGVPRLSSEERRKKSSQQAEDWHRTVKEVLSETQLIKYGDLKGRQFIPSRREFAVPPDRFPLSRGFNFTPPSALLGLAAREPVLKELGIGNESAEAESLRKLRQALRQETNPLNPSYIPGVSEHLRIKYELALQKIFTPDQMMRLRQINLQNLGLTLSIFQPRVSQELKLTPEQLNKLSELRAEGLRIVTEISTAPDLPESERRKMLSDNRAEQEQQLKEALTKEQQAKLAEMMGKPFDVSALRGAFVPNGFPSDRP